MFKQSKKKALFCFFFVASRLRSLKVHCKTVSPLFTACRVDALLDFPNVLKRKVHKTV